MHHMRVNSMHEGILNIINFIETESSDSTNNESILCHTLRLYRYESHRIIGLVA